MKIVVYLFVIILISNCKKKDHHCDDNDTTGNCSLNSLASGLKSGLVAFYPFCGNANDISGNNNNGTVNGASLTEDRFGHLNSAYNFDGVNDKITVNDNSFLNPSYLSVSLWYKTNNTSSTQALLYKSTWIDASNEEYAFVINYLTPGQIVAGIKKNSECKPALGWKRTFINNSTSQWHHYVFTYNGAVARVYLDGTLVTTNTSISGPIDVCSGGTLTIGAGWSGDPGWWNGIIDDVMIYNRALSEIEVQQLNKK